MGGINESHFSFKCPMNWDEMEPSASGRFCCRCRKEVFDLTNCSVDEVIALQRKHGPICGSIRVMQTAAVAISLSAAACQNDGVKPEEVPPTPGDQAVAQRRYTGTPVAPGRLERRYPPVMGKVSLPLSAEKKEGE